MHQPITHSSCAKEEQKHNVDEAHDGCDAGPASNDDDPRYAVLHHRVEGIHVGVKPVHIHQHTLGAPRSLRPFHRQPQCTRPRPKVLDVNRKNTVLPRRGRRVGEILLGNNSRRCPAQSHSNSVRFVRSERARDADVDERSTPGWFAALGVFEDEAGVCVRGEQANEAGWGGRGGGVPPSVPVAPSAKEASGIGWGLGGGGGNR